MKVSEIREYSEQELLERLEAERERLHKLRMSHAISPIENPMQLRETKRTIARILTVLTQKRLGIVK